MTKKQRKLLFAIAKQVPIDIESMRDLCLKINSSRSISSLDTSQGTKLISKVITLFEESLRSSISIPYAEYSSGTITSKQKVQIRALSYDLNMNKWDVSNWLRTYIGTHNINSISIVQARKVIKSFKVMKMNNKNELLGEEVYGKSAA